MAGKSKRVILNRSRKDDSALQRILCLPMVNSACSSLQKTYATTKESHPLLVSVCEAYGKGIQTASALAMWSVKPVVRKLEPQLAAANVLACQGLDHLEQRIPALHKPVEEVTSELKDSIQTHVQRAMHSVADTLDWILGLATESCEQVQNMVVTEVAENVQSGRVSRLARTGAEAAVGRVEKLADQLLPKTEHNSEVRVSKEASLASIFGRIRSLASIVSQHAYRQTAQAIQHAREKGQEWAMWIPSLGGLTRQSSTKAQQVFSDAQNTASGWLRQRKLPEEAGKQNEDGRPSTAAETAKAQSLVDSLTQNLQAAYLAIIFGVKEAPLAARNMAGRLLQLSAHKAASETSTKAGALWGVLQEVTGSFLGTVLHYVPVPRLLVKEEGTAAVTTNGAKTRQRQESSPPVATNAQEGGGPCQPRGDLQSNQGHHPLPFLNFKETPLSQPAPFQHRSLAFEAESAGSRRSAFSPYREAAGSRRWSEGLYHPSPEPMYSRAHHSGLYGMILKKD